MACGRTLHTSTSLTRASLRTRSLPRGVLRSRATLRLLRLKLRNDGLIESCRFGFMERSTSPSTASILITSAPMSPRICVAHGPITTAVRSRTRTPASGPLFDAGTGVLHDFRPRRDFARQEGAELLRRRELQHHALRRELRLHGRIIE